MSIKQLTQDKFISEVKSLGRKEVAIIAMIIGFLLVFVVGLANNGEIHNAAHDTRHSMSFPCH